MNYEELVKALLSASTVSTAWGRLMQDAAAAIEALQAEMPKRGEMKNADKIRAMSDEELARWVVDEGRYFGEEYEGYMSCLDWLKEEVQE